MTVELLATLAVNSAFRPRHHFSQLAHDHVPFDYLTGESRFEAPALAAVTNDIAVVGVIGPRGGGKSSLIAQVCAELPDSHVALRVPVTGADDPTDVSVVAAVALAQALNDLELEQYQREALEKARADTRTSERVPASFGGTLGGGPVPAEVRAELATLREQVESNPLAVDRLMGLERLSTILVARGLQPVYVLEDTEAAIGGEDRPDTANAFFDGPVRAFVTEVEAPALIAIQNVFTTTSAFPNLAASMTLIDIPTFGDDDAREAFTAIVENRLAQQEVDAKAEDLLDADALENLIAFYVQAARNLRFTLAALQAAVEYAAEGRAERIGAGHVRAAATDWRDRLDL